MSLLLTYGYNIHSLCPTQSYDFGQLSNKILKSSLKHGNPHIKLKNDCSNRPNVTRLIPTKFQNDFRCSKMITWKLYPICYYLPIMTSGDNSTVMFMVEGCRTHVYYTNIWSLQPPILNFLDMAVDILRVRIYLSSSSRRLFDFEVRIDKKNIFWFQVSMCKSIIMHEFYSPAKLKHKNWATMRWENTHLVGHVSDMFECIGPVAIIFLEVKCRLSKDRKW